MCRKAVYIVVKVQVLILRVCVSNKLPGDAKAADLQASLNSKGGTQDT